MHPNVEEVENELQIGVIGVTYRHIKGIDGVETMRQLRSTVLQSDTITAPLIHSEEEEGNVGVIRMERRLGETMGKELKHKGKEGGRRE